MAVFLAACLVVFALQNVAEVEVQVLVWSFTAHRFIIVLVSCLVGLAIGWLLKSQAVKRARQKAQSVEIP